MFDMFNPCMAYMGNKEYIKLQQKLFKNGSDGWSSKLGASIAGSGGRGSAGAVADAGGRMTPNGLLE